MQHFDRDLAAVLVERTIQRGVAAAAHRRDDVVAVAQRLAHPSDQFASHRGRIGGPQPEKGRAARAEPPDRKSTRLNSSHGYISYAVFCLKKKNTTYETHRIIILDVQ